MKREKLLRLGVSAAGGLTLFLLWLRWFVQGHSPAGAIASVCSCALFLAFGLCYVPRFLSFWRAEKKRSFPSGKEPKDMNAYLLFGGLLFCTALLFFNVFLCRLLGKPLSFSSYIKLWCQLDSQHYLQIARDWYSNVDDLGRCLQLVFLPGYPVLVRLLMLLTGSDVFAGFAVSWLSFSLGLLLFYRLLRLDYPHETALRGVLFLCLSPGSFFFVAPMSESLFFCLTVGSLYSSRKKNWLPACLCACYASFTRSLGLLLLVPLIMEFVHQKADWKKAPLLLLAPLGFAAYLLVNYLVTGNPLQFMNYQAEHWHQHLGLFFNTASYQTENLIKAAGENLRSFFGLWLPNLLCSFCALALMIYGARRLRASYTGFFLWYYIIAIGATWLLSAPRYLLVMPTLPLSLALLGEKKAWRWLLYPLLILLSLGYCAAFLLRWQVW